MGYPSKNSRIGQLAKTFSTENNMTYEEACFKQGLLTLEDSGRKLIDIHNKCGSYPKYSEDFIGNYVRE